MTRVEKAPVVRRFDLGYVALLASAFLVTAGFRFLGLRNGFVNDHFMHLSGAQQMLFGDWPTRDFLDPGMPLMIAASAWAQAVLGPTLLSEAVLVAAAFGVGAALTAAVVANVTGSKTLAVLAVLFEIAVFPRTYGYPKVLLYAAGFWLFGHYLAKAGTSRLLWMAAGIAAAFLFRHDHGIFLYVGGVLTALFASNHSGSKPTGRVATFSLGVGLMLLPYIAYVHAHQGWSLYLRSALAYSRREAENQGYVWPGLFGANPLEAALLYEFHLIPLVALVVLAALWSTRGEWKEATYLLPIVVVAGLVNFSVLREPLSTRLPDAIVPAVILGAWLVSVAWRRFRRRLFTAPLVLLVIVTFAVPILSVGNTLEEVDRAGLMAGWRKVPGRFRERALQLNDRFSDSQVPNSRIAALVPFFRYLGRCTTREHRLLNLGPEYAVPFFAGDVPVAVEI